MQKTLDAPTLDNGYMPTSVFSYPTQAGIREDMLGDFTKYLETTKGSAYTYARALKQFFAWMKAQGISEPTREDLKNYRDFIAGDHQATTTASYINALKQFYKWLDYKGYAKDITNHLKGARVSHEHRKDALTVEQAKELLNSIEQNSLEGMRDFAITYLCLSCGLRTIEVVRANVEDMHYIAGDMALAVQGKGKQDKADYVKVPYQVEKAIRAYLGKRGSVSQDAPLFASDSDRNQGGRLTTRTISGIVKGELRKCDFDSPRLTAHSLRHTTATLNLLNGGTLEETQQLLRHTNINTTMIYNHALERAKNHSEKRVADLLEESEGK
jgi:integrase/recombinase XerD